MLLTQAYLWHTVTCNGKEVVPISKMFRRHIGILALRFVLLAAAVTLWTTDKEGQGFTDMLHRGFNGVFLWVVWAVMVAGMLLRLAPNKRIAIGARKHYGSSYHAAHLAQGANEPVGMIAKRNRLHKGAITSAIAWIVFNAVVFIMFSLKDLLTPMMTMILMLFYSVCDMVCILIFCPFKVFFLSNRCCVDCRIHNWDYLMMCTPLILFPSLYSLSLLLLSAAVVLRWELALWRNPNYFMSETNENLRCERCSDRLCMLHDPLEK